MQENTTKLSTSQAKEKELHRTVNSQKSPFLCRQKLHFRCGHILRSGTLPGPEWGLSKYESHESASAWKAPRIHGVQNTTGTHKCCCLFHIHCLFQKLSVSSNPLMSYSRLFLLNHSNSCTDVRTSSVNRQSGMGPFPLKGHREAQPSHVL